MRMAMGIVALTKDRAVLLGRKIRVVVEMRSRKLDFAREENHDGLIILSIRESQWHTPGPSIRFFPIRGSDRTPIAHQNIGLPRVHNKRRRKKGNGYEPVQVRRWCRSRA